MTDLLLMDRTVLTPFLVTVTLAISPGDHQANLSIGVQRLVAVLDHCWAQDTGLRRGMNDGFRENWIFLGDRGRGRNKFQVALLGADVGVPEIPEPSVSLSLTSQ